MGGATSLGALSVLVALVLSPAAAGHGGGGALGYRSTVTAVTPAVPGLEVMVRDFDDRLRLRNDTGRPIVVFGYEGEPYLAFRDGKVFRNARSPATYLNDERFGGVRLPVEADPRAPPRWIEVAPRETYEWHDHRIHWMSRDYPPKVAAARDQSHHIFDWTVPGSIGGRELLIAGSLDYEPPGGGGFPTILLLPLVVLGVAGPALIWLRRRHEAERALRGDS